VALNKELKSAKEENTAMNDELTALKETVSNL
jgi:predicted  nucleic acid-binding Zn-ribbon protein